MIKTVGIVAEYNPFHNGHKSLINFAKNSGYSHCVAIMSGNFVQRSYPAITEKKVRAKAALMSGVDLVIELPVSYATATAQLFSRGALATLKATGIVDALGFGSEAGNTNMIKNIVEVIETNKFSRILRQFLAEGMTFAKARSRAIKEILGTTAAEISKEPNNLLGIEDLSAARTLGWDVAHLTVPRFKVGHHSQTPIDQFASASLIREQRVKWENIANYVPQSSLNTYQIAEKMGEYPASWKTLEIAVLSVLRHLTIEKLSALPDISEGIEYRFYNEIQKSTSVLDLMENLKTKRYPLSRVRRLILSGFLGLKNKDVISPPPYIRILGFNNKGKALLSIMKHTAKLPFSHSLATLERTSSEAKNFAKLESSATDQYALCLPRVKKCGYDYSSSAVFLD